MTRWEATRARVALATMIAAVLTGAITATTTKAHPKSTPGRLTVAEPEFLEQRAAAPEPNLPGDNLRYGGGTTDGAVVTQPEVYLVFWGSQWSTSDPVVGCVQRFLNGLYGAGDDWTPTMSQYCQSGDMAWHTQTCSKTATFIGKPEGSLIKGVWFDDSGDARESKVTSLTAVEAAHRLGSLVAVEATKAAAHFTKITPASNRNAVYLVMTPPGFSHGKKGAYCAYHTSVTSNYGSVAYAHIPYIPEFGDGCGGNSVNHKDGYLDGVSIVVGHELVELLTNPRPSTGWIDNQDHEAADKCEWIPSGQGAMANLQLSTGRFPVQSIWSNHTHSCLIHAA